QYVLKLLNSGKKYIPDFYQSDLIEEFSLIWEKQREFYQEQLSDTLFSELQGKNKAQTWAICKEPFSILGIKQNGSKVEQKKERYQWRVDGLDQKLELENLAIVLQEINGEINKSSGYLGAI